MYKKANNFDILKSYVKKTVKFTHRKRRNLKNKINRITDILRRDDGIIIHLSKSFYLRAGI